MIFSTRAEYGVRLMVELGRQHSDGPTPLNVIADAEGLPLPYLEHVVAKLKKVPSSQRTFSLDGGIKDVRQMLAEGEKRGLELPLLKQTLACYEEAKRTVGGSEEVSNVSVYWAGRAKP